MEEVLEKIEEQLQCSVCLETYTNPKQLLCQHTCCLECLRPLVKSQQGQLSVSCPLCRHVTPVPAEGVAGLQSAVHITGLLEIRDSVTKIPEPVKELESPANHELDYMEALTRRHREFDRALAVKQRQEKLQEIFSCPAFPHKHVVLFGPFDAAIVEMPRIVNVKVEDVCGSKTTCGVVVNHYGLIVVSDEAKHSVTTFHFLGVRFGSFGTYGSGEGQLNSPRGLALDGEGYILVADCRNHRIQMFTEHGTFLEAVGSKGSGHLQFKFPKDIAVNPITKMVYVVDANHRVQILNSDLSYSKIFGTRGQSRGQFIDPQGIACDSIGNVYVADTGNHRVQVFSSRGEFMLMFGNHGKGIGELDYPYGLAFDHRDLVHVSEYNNDRISVFTWDGQYLSKIERCFGLSTKPRGLAVNSDGSLYVCDSNSTKSLIGMARVCCVPKDLKKHELAFEFIKKWRHFIAIIIVAFILGCFVSYLM